MTITISKRVITPLLTLLIGFALGVTGTLPSNAEDPAPVVQGEILKVCINLKTGVIRVANKCDTKTERKTILGGVGAQGAKGDKGDTGATGAIGAQGPQGSIGATGPQGERGLTGATGATGPQGERGLTGATGAQGPQGERGLTGATGAQGLQGIQGATGANGSLSGLRTQTIDFLSASWFGCPGFGTSQPVVTDISVYTSSFSGKTTITPSKTTLSGCSLRVYTP